MNETGMTLIELLVVATVVTILVLVLGFEFTGWQAKYRVEAQIKTLQGDLMDMRMRAMKTNKLHYLRLDTADFKRYNVFDDAGKVADLSQSGLNYSLRWNFSGNPADISVNNKGLVNRIGTIWLVDPSNAIYADEDVDYDCVVIARTRINMGKLNKDPKDGGACVAK